VIKLNKVINKFIGGLALLRVTHVHCVPRNLSVFCAQVCLLAHIKDDLVCEILVHSLYRCQCR